MKRKIYEQLLNWKKEEHGESAVLIEGARRVGKSWIAEEFAKSKVGRRKNIIPIEVKSKKRYTTNSLDKFTSKYKAKIDSPIVLHTKDLGVKGGVTYLPLYMAPML